MALSKKEKQRMGDAMMVAGTIRAASETYKAVKPIVKKGVKKAKELYKKVKDKRKYDNNNYKEGK